MEILEQENYLYTLSKNSETDECCLEVECGRAAVFTVRIKLNPSEISAYKENPKFIKDLAGQIVSSPNDFQHRHIQFK